MTYLFTADEAGEYKKNPMSCPKCGTLPISTEWRYTGNLMYPLHGCGNDLTCDMGKLFRETGGTTFGSIYGPDSVEDIPGRKES